MTDEAERRHVLEWETPDGRDGWLHLESGELPHVLRACLQAYEDPETGMSGVKMVERAVRMVKFHMGVEPDDEEYLDALRRLLDPIPHEEGDG